MATSSITIPTIIQGTKFLGQTHLLLTPNRSVFPPSRQQSIVHQVKAMAKFNLYGKWWEEEDYATERKASRMSSKRNIEKEEQETSKAENETEKESDDSNLSFKVPWRRFLRKSWWVSPGGFPGGEKGLKTFIEQNPPPPPKRDDVVSTIATEKKPRAPELPLLISCREWSL